MNVRDQYFQNQYIEEQANTKHIFLNNSYLDMA